MLCRGLYFYMGFSFVFHANIFKPSRFFPIPSTNTSSFQFRPQLRLVNFRLSTPSLVLHFTPDPIT